MKLRLVLIPLAPLCLYWWIESWVRQKIGLPRQHNCFTWLLDNFDYWGGDGIMGHRTVSDSWFPHVTIVKGARSSQRMTITIIEYIPKVRDPAVTFPKHKFDGYVRTTVLVNSELQSASHS